MKDLASVSYPDDARPGCLVQQDGRWLPGSIHSWEPDAAGWTAVVSFFSAPDVAYMVRVPAQRVRGHEPGAAPPPTEPSLSDAPAPSDDGSSDGAGA